MKNLNLNKIPELIILISLFMMTFGVTAAADNHQSSGNLKIIKGPQNAEDILPIGDTQWLVTSGMNGQTSRSDINGHIYLVNRKEKTFEELFPGKNPTFDHDKKMFSECPRPINPDKFSSHGLALKELSPGQYRLYMTSHGEREAIEIFNINTGGVKPAITWTGCVPLSEDIMANSVAILSDGGFVTTKFHDPTIPNSMMGIMQGKLTGGVHEWHPGGSVKAIPGTELSGANGIAVSPDDKYVYVAAFGSREIVRFDCTKSPVKLEKVKIGIMPDNIHWGNDGLLYTAGNNRARGTGWSVMSIHPETLEIKWVTGVDQTAAMQNVSSAVPVDGEIWVGTFSGDRIGFLPRP
ncbi:SMP-30/gluconolactonase/LRE family protein [Thermodesulfobacteriota bacterium]